MTLEGPLQDVVWVFEGWSWDDEYPDQVGPIWCCGHSVVMRAGAITCDECHTVVEQKGLGWRVVRIKGYVPKAAEVGGR